MDTLQQNNFLINEYTQICNNLRHLNDLRSKVVQFTVTIYGLLLITLTAILKSEVSSFIQTHYNNIIFLISILGVIIMFIHF